MLLKWLVCLHVESGSWITKQSLVNIVPSQNKFVYPYTVGKGMSVETWKHLEESSANTRKDAIDGINSSRSRRGQIAKCVRAPRWACVERGWPLIETSTAATHDGVSIRTSCCRFASTSNLVRRHSSAAVMISHYSCNSRRRCDTPFALQYKVSTALIKQGKWPWA